MSQSGLLALLEGDESIVADKGFDIQHILGTIAVRLNMAILRESVTFAKPAKDSMLSCCDSAAEDSCSVSSSSVLIKTLLIGLLT